MGQFSVRRLFCRILGVFHLPFQVDLDSIVLLQIGVWLHVDVEDEHQTESKETCQRMMNYLKQYLNLVNE
jgi:hypothetical protein